MRLFTSTNASQGIVTTKAQPVLGLFVGLLLGGVVSCLFASSALAQFDKSRWPAQAPTPALDVVDLQGKVWSAQDLAGHVVVLNFWATWCAPCKEELPTLQTLHDIRDAHTLVLAVNVREPSLRVARYVQATGVTLPVLLDPKGELAKCWGVTVFPTTVLLAPDGQARWRVMGDVDWSGPEANRWLTEVRQDTRAANALAKPAPLKR
jgi:thiol-disulfide isomerase/thioredoxin